MTDAAQREARERVVREHMEAENRLDFDAALATFEHPRYELIGTDQVHDGPVGGRAVLSPIPRGVSEPA